MEKRGLQRSEKPRNFNKKKWRETQYSHKQKVTEWEMKRKQAVQRKYRKMLTTDPNAASGSYKVPIREDEVDSDEDANQNQEYKPQPRLSEFQKAKLQYEMIQKEKEEKKQEKILKQQERIEAVKKSKQERLERIKKLTQKTKKGQPVMKGRIELLLQKIQRQVGPVTSNQ